MSAIAGAYSRTGAPIDRNVLAQMSDDLHHMGPDAESFACSAQIGMLHRSLYTDRRSRGAHQPFAAQDGYMVTVDGGLDNYDDLKRELMGRNAPAVSDAELAFAAYRRWGIESFARLIGDFALALWDPHEHQLVLCCDALGRRPLFYHVAPTAVFWASRCRTIQRTIGLPLAFDDEYVADFLAGQPTTHSPIRGIQAVLGGQLLIVTRRQIAVRRYWTFEPQRQISYRSDEEYESHFLELFEEAVACRLRADAPVYCELSGGLDSSSIYCVADRLLTSGRAEAPDLRGVSYIFDGSSSSDEREYISHVVANVGRSALQISDADCPILAPLPALLSPDIPTDQLCFIARQDFLTREMNLHGARVLLSGMGGDQLFWSQPPDALPLADLLVQGEFRKLLRNAREWSRTLRWSLLRTLWFGGCWPALPRTWQARTQRISPHAMWLAPEFAKRTEFLTRAWRAPDDIGFPRPSGAWHYASIRRSMRLDVMEWCSSEGYLDVRLPYLDRRLAEFALAIPLEQMIRPSETRSIVRRTLRGVLPDVVRRRATKAGPSEAFLRALIREWRWLRMLFVDPRVSAHGWVDRDAFVAALSRARHGVVANLGELSATISLELWIRMVEDCTPRAGSGDSAPPGWRPFDHHPNHHHTGGDHDSRHNNLRTA